MATAFDITTCARPNILSLQPYRCARDDYKDDGTNVLLDANENAYGPGLSLSSEGRLLNGASGDEAVAVNGDAAISDIELDLRGLNRYPDPHQLELKELLCKLRQTNTHREPNAPPLTPENLFVGVGSDEAIDALLRAFCVPGRDKILTCPPTYGMYTVSAHVNDVEIVTVPLNAADEFTLDAPAICARLDEDIAAASTDPTAGRIKLIYLCHPGNPTSRLLSKPALHRLLTHPTWNGLLILDEAYIDFSPPGSSLAEWTTAWPNLVVMQTLSKAFGLAGLRLGAAFASPPVARLLNNLKAPYNVSSVTSALAAAALHPRHLAAMRRNTAAILAQRERLAAGLRAVPGVGRFRGGQDANFLLVEMLGADGRPDSATAMAVYEALAQTRGVVVRFRGREVGCEGCLRVTVGTAEEVDRFLRELRGVLADVHAGRAKGAPADPRVEEVREERESAAVP